MHCKNDFKPAGASDMGTGNNQDSDQVSCRQHVKDQFKGIVVVDKYHKQFSRRHVTLNLDPRNNYTWLIIGGE